MSFRDNLQHLRATRGMTQEQLAMLLGVSRQAVTKWESERAYPEMDKLLKMCQIFGCTLDELVQGDLTHRPADPAAAHVPAGPVQDVCGYDEHMRRFAWQLPTGISIILLGVAVGFFFEGRAPLWSIDSDALFVIIILVAGVVGLAFGVVGGMEHSAFVKAHPYIEDFYTEDQRAAARSRFAVGLVAGVAIIVAGVAFMLATDGRLPEYHVMPVFMACVAVGVWLIVHVGMMLGRTNVAEYNRNVAEELEIEDIVNAQVDDARREALLDQKRRNQRIGAVCGAIMIVSTIVALVWLFLPLATSGTWGDVGDYNPEGTSAMWFWVAWPIGGMLCVVASLLMNAFGKKE